MVMLALDKVCNHRYYTCNCHGLACITLLVMARVDIIMQYPVNCGQCLNKLFFVCDIVVYVYQFWLMFTNVHCCCPLENRLSCGRCLTALPMLRCVFSIGYRLLSLFD